MSHMALPINKRIKNTARSRGYPNTHPPSHFISDAEQIVYLASDRLLCSGGEICPAVYVISPI